MFQVVLKSLRENTRISQAELAKRLGVSQSTVGMWESGKNKPEYKMLIKIAEYFNVSVSELIGEEEKPIFQGENGLSEDEIKLIELFREVPPEQQKTVLGSVELALRMQGLLK